MLEVDVIGSARRGIGVGALVGRVRAALASVGVSAPRTSGPDARHLVVVVDPAAWFAEQSDAGSPPSPAYLTRVLGLSTAVPQTPLFDDEAALGRALGAVLHHDPQVVADFHRRDCRAVVLPYGVLPQRVAGDGDVDRPIAIATAGPDCERRNRVLAHGAPWFATVPCHHRLSRDVDGDADPFTAARVVLDVLTGDRLPPDPVTVLAAIEAGAALVVEERGALLAEELVPSVLCAPDGTGFALARDLAQDPDRAAALASAAYAEVAAAHPLATMGAALIAAAEEVGDQRSPRSRPVELHRAWSDEPEPVVDRLRRMREREDGPVREGLREVLETLRGIERRLGVLESGVDAEAVDEVYRAGGAAEGESPQVSVLIPAYHAAQWVRDAVASVHANAREAWPLRLEAIVVDDASPSDDGALVAAWAADHPDLDLTVVRHRANRGLAAARNTAVARARAPFVLPLDADNALLEGGAKRLFVALHDDPAAAFAYGILQERTVHGPSGLRNARPWDRERLRQGNFVDALALLRRETLLTVGGYATDMPAQGYEDWDLWCRLVEHGHHGVHVPEMVASYRVRLDSMSERLHLSHIGPLTDMVVRHPDLLA